MHAHALDPNPSTLTRDSAEAIAVQVLAFIARDEYRTRQFLNISGLTPETVRPAARSNAFLLGVLDYVSSDEGLLKAFSIEDRTHPQSVAAARSALAPDRPSAPAPTRSIVIECGHCRTTSIRTRSELPHAPPTATKLSMPRCGKCGGGFDQVETWLDRRGNELE